MRTPWSRMLAASALPLSAGLAACSTSNSQPPSPAVVVTWTDVKQPIDGFGASSAFFGQTLTNDQADLLFDAKKGIGLSLLRMMIGVPDDTQSDGTEPTTGADPVATAPELATAQQAVARGAKVWAAAWTPPPIWKTTNSKNGSMAASDAGAGFATNTLMPAHYQDYANYLANFVTLVTSANPPVPLYGLSPANEPDYVPTYDGCEWAPDDLTTFIGQFLGPTFATQWPNVKIIAPETVNCPSCDTYVAPLLADPMASKALSIVAAHEYGANSPVTYDKPAQAGKEFWQSEWSTENANGDTPDPTMTNAITIATQVHNYMTTTGVNAWHYWALYATWDDFDTNTTRQNPALIQPAVDGGAPYAFKRAYALGNWSKFVRPGFVRIGATDTPVPGLLVEAYRDNSNDLAIVAVNTTAAPVTQTFNLTGGTFGTVTPWLTDANDDLAPQSPIAATNSFTFNIPATSLVTFVNWDATMVTPGLVIPVYDAGAGGDGGDATTPPMGDTSSLDCNDPVTPDNVVNGGVTDFTDWAGSTGKWGSPDNLYGAVYAYSGPDGTMVMQNVDTANKDLHVTGTVASGDYGGAGLAFYDCATVASFTAVQFTVSGSAPGCEMDLQIKTFDQQPTSQTPAGGCDSGSCYNFPAVTSIAVPTATPQTIIAPLSSFSTWSSADATQVVGLQWQFNANDVGAEGSCPVDVAITGIKFITDTGSGSTDAQADVSTTGTFDATLGGSTDAGTDAD